MTYYPPRQRPYMPPENACRYCGNDGSDIISCVQCRPPGQIQTVVLRKMLEGDELDEKEPRDTMMT